VKVAIVGQSWLGAEVFASLRDWGCEPYAAVAPAGDRLAAAAAAAGVPCMMDPHALAGRAFDLTIAAHAQHFIPPVVLATPAIGTIAYHPSLLPRHRGRDAVRWTIHMRDPIAGGTVYWMAEEIDGGPVAARDWCFVRPDDTATTLWRRELGPMGVRLLGEAVRDILAGEAMRLPQDPRAATWEPAFRRPRLAESRPVRTR